MSGHFSWPGGRPRSATAFVIVLIALAFGGAPSGVDGQSGAPTQTRMREEWCPEPEVGQFDFWLGEWDVQNRNRPPNGERWYSTGTATNRVYTVVGGCAIVEHWRGHAFPSAGHIQGFSLRAWDPSARQWELVLLWPTNGVPRFGNPTGAFEDGRGDFHSRFTNPSGDTILSRLSFYDIEEDAFTWSDGLSQDGGRTWASSWIMEQTRRPLTAPGLWNGPSMRTDRCPGEEHRTFDAWLGGWVGTREAGTSDEAAVRSHLVRILDGCAVLERAWTEDGSWAAFRVRAWEPATEAWVEYGLASDRREIIRREGRLEDDVLVFTDVEPARGTFRRTRWSREGAAWSRVVEEASDPGGPWTTIREDRYASRLNERPPSEG